MKNFLCIVSALCFVIIAQAQNEMNNWAFGVNGGLTWNSTRSFNVTSRSPAATGITSLTGLPTSFASSISTQEGCYSLSDGNGSLMFYSDGMTIWDKNGAVMTNGTGLFGNSSSAQAGILIPYPDHPQQYLSVSIGLNSSPQLSYSIVDMTANGGLGAVTATKNVLLTGGSGKLGESVTSIKHANGKDYWIVAPGKGTTTYLNAWLVTSAGVQISNPIVSTMPAGFSTGSPGYGGYFKFTVDGKHYAWGNTESYMYYGDFDASTGIFSNFNKMSGFVSSTNYGVYGVEFTSSGKYLYITDQSSLYVFDFAAIQAVVNPTVNTVTNKKFSVAMGAIQLGPDKRMYVAGGYKSTGMVIVDNPEEFNNLKVFQTANSFLATGTTGWLGLPSFAASWFDFKPEAKSFACTGYNYKFTTTVNTLGANVPTKLLLDYGDGNTGTLNLIAGQTDYTISHTYLTAGTYNVKITPAKADDTTLPSTAVIATAVDCSIRSNRMIRLDVRNEKTLPVTKQ